MLELSLDYVEDYKRPFQDEEVDNYPAWVYEGVLPLHRVLAWLAVVRL